MLNWWNKFSDVGIHDGLSLTEMRKIRMVNQSCLTAIFTCLFNGIINFYIFGLEAFFINWLCCLIFSGVIFLQKKGYYQAARVSVIGFGVSVLALVSFIYGESHALNYMYLCTFVGGMVMFDGWKSYVLLTLSHSAALLFGKLNNLLGREPILMYENLDSVSNVLLFTAFALLLITVDLLKSENKRFETKTNELVASLKVKNQELERANDELEQFAYIASHDLKEPLRNITGFSTLIQRKIEQKKLDEVGEYVPYILDGTKRIYRLIDDILAYAQAGTLTAKKPVQLEAILHEVQQNLAPLTERKKAHIISKTALPEILGEKTELLQIFQNFVENGIKYNESDTPTVEISYQNKLGKHFFIFKDNGIGMEKDYHRQIFQMFKRLHPRSKYDGTGIGLAICKKIINNWHGDIVIDSAPQKGSMFTISMPVFHAAAEVPATVDVQHQ